jgi:hypothetical protein
MSQPPQRPLAGDQSTRPDPSTLRYLDRISKFSFKIAQVFGQLWRALTTRTSLAIFSACRFSATIWSKDYLCSDIRATSPEWLGNVVAPEGQPRFMQGLEKGVS